MWMPFPTERPVTAQNMNYAGPLVGVVVAGALLDWGLGGRKRFRVPVAWSGGLGFEGFGGDGGGGQDANSDGPDLGPNSIA
jgi:hypothetical protein